MQDHVLSLGRGDDRERLGELGRCYHTLKGAAGCVGLTGLSASIHSLEELLISSNAVAPPELVRRLEESLDEIDAVREAFRTPGDTAPSPSRAPLPAIEPGRGADSPPFARPEANRVEGGFRPSPAGPESDGLLRVPADRFEELIELASELMTRRGSWGAHAERMKQFAATAQLCHQRLRTSIERLEMAVPSPSECSPDTGGDEGNLAGGIRRLTEQAEDLAALASTAREAAIPMGDEGEVLERLSLQVWARSRTSASFRFMASFNAWCASPVTPRGSRGERSRSISSVRTPAPIVPCWIGCTSPCCTRSATP